jgi:hypothetical protein
MAFRGRSSALRASRHKKLHSDPGRGPTTMVVHRTSGRGLAQRGHLLVDRQLPSAWDQPAGIPDGHPEPLAGTHDQPDRSTASRELEALVRRAPAASGLRFGPAPYLGRNQSPSRDPGHLLRLTLTNLFFGNAPSRAAFAFSGRLENRNAGSMAPFDEKGRGNEGGQPIPAMDRSSSSPKAKGARWWEAAGRIGLNLPGLEGFWRAEGIRLE